MLLGAFVTWAWIPEVQYPRRYDSKRERDENVTDDGIDMENETFRQKLKFANRPLLDIAQNPGDGQILGMRHNISRPFRATQTRVIDKARRRRSTAATDPRTDLVDEHDHVHEAIDARQDEADVGDGLGTRCGRYE
ncbi:uncharacterized protein F4812DRAFT_456168 [Daldinia caldariorum]|uniref:uncharacterized protein n=1 Tax=Daldinia caldariorum TaxID=326644 RepID=UPI002007F45F|nr:uncharacterized protein F4812DRAFT_456168 [Daldinia caldariorum]KAI1472072.1 hypothetical protein F4812DRAFT_456168 [Daldinia caldariorum]